MEEDVLKHIFKTLNNTCKYEIDYLGIKLNWVTIPRLTYSEAVQILEKEMDFKLQEVGLTTQAEKLISEYIKSKSNSDFVFITKYPLSERPFYAMPSENGIDSETFELLYKGTEITSGGQRIHNYEELVRSITLKGLNPDNFQSYLMPFKYGMPPHGGMGLGLERLMKQMLDLQVVDEASLIPRTKDKFIH
jgi:nondiscriminating aspartyl-tRNA synthetase